MHKSEQAHIGKSEDTGIVEQPSPNFESRKARITAAEKLAAMKQPFVAAGVGIPGSGKSTIIGLIADSVRAKNVDNDVIIINPDSIREELTGDMRDQSKNKEVWEETYRRLEEAIKNNSSVIIDATFTNPEHRRMFIERCNELNITSIAAIMVPVDLDVAKHRNERRARVVPPYVLDDKYQELQENPTLEGEGFSEVVIIPNNSPDPELAQDLSEPKPPLESHELADYIKDQIIYTGLFVDPIELYEQFPPSLSHKIRDPHVTVSYRPDGAEGVFLDALSTGAIIRVVGYGNNGENEGLLVEVTAEDPVIQKALNERIAQGESDEIKSVPTHITLSIAEGCEAVNTRNLHFEPLENPTSFTGKYKLFRNDGILISDKDTIRQMKKEGFLAQKVKDPDWL